MHTQLQTQDIDAILASPETLALYLMTLSSAQLAEFAAAIPGIDVPQEAKEYMQSVVLRVQSEVEQYEDMVAKQIAPGIAGISTAMTLLQQITLLEELERSL